MPDAGFYLWADVSNVGQGDDVAFALDLLAQYNVAVLPGSLLAREAQGINPGAGRIRLALVAEVDECVELRDERSFNDFDSRMRRADNLKRLAIGTRSGLRLERRQ